MWRAQTRPRVHHQRNRSSMTPQTKDLHGFFIPPKQIYEMKQAQFSIRFILVAVGAAALALWLLLPTPRIEIRIMPNNSLRLDSETFPSDREFWLAFGRRVELNRRWARESQVQILAPSTIAHTSIIGVMLSLPTYDIDDYSVHFYDQNTGELLPEVVFQ